MLSSSRTFLTALTALIVCVAAWSLSAGGNGSIGFAFLDTWEDDPAGAVPWGLVTPGVPAIKTESGEVVSLGSTDARAIVEVTAIHAPGGALGHVLRVSDANYGLGGGHSEVTVRPFGASGTVKIWFDLRLVDLTNDAVTLSIVDNRTTPGTGRLVTLAIGSDGRVSLADQSTPMVLGVGEWYRFVIDLDLAGKADSFDLRIEPSTVEGPSFSVTDFPIAVDALTVTDMTFALSNTGAGAFDLDDVRVFAGS